jgi:hypothetical protein
MSAMCYCTKIIGVTEGCIRVLQWSHTIVQRRLRNKQWLESDEVVEIAKFDAQKKLLFCSESNQYPGRNLNDMGYTLTLYNDITLTTQASR